MEAAPNTVTQRLAALRFFYIQVLKRGWSAAETPYPKKVLHLPHMVGRTMMRALEESRIVDQRLQFLSSYQKEEMLVSDLCREIGVYQLTGYRRINRYKEVGPEGLIDLSGRPPSCSHATLERTETRSLRYGASTCPGEHTSSRQGLSSWSQALTGQQPARSAASITLRYALSGMRSCVARRLWLGHIL